METLKKLFDDTRLVEEGPKDKRFAEPIYVYLCNYCGKETRVWTQHKKRAVICPDCEAKRKNIVAINSQKRTLNRMKLEAINEMQEKICQTCTPFRSKCSDAQKKRCTYYRIYADMAAELQEKIDAE